MESISFNRPRKIKVEPGKEKYANISRVDSSPLWLNSSRLMDEILKSLEKRRPCSIVSLGATEAFVMAQYTLFSEEEFMQHPEALVANRGARGGHGHRGISFPNLRARDDTVEAVRKARIVGYNSLVEPAREMAEKVLEAYAIQPRYLFEANIRRVLLFSQREKFEAMLRGRKLLLISSLAPRLKVLRQQEYKDRLDCDLVAALSIYDYEEIPEVKRQLDRYDFDLCLLAAGVNAIILATHIAESLGKVAFDIGWCMETMISGEIFVDPWLGNIIGLEKLLQM